MKIKAIIFDMGGVVLNAQIENAYEILATKLKITKDQFDEVKNKYIKDAQKGKITDEKMVKDISVELNISYEKILSYWKEAYSEVMIINSEVLSLVKKLKKDGFIVALISNTIGIHSNINKEREVYKEFNPVILSNEVGLIKPEKEIYELMLKKLNLSPKECIFIDDRPEHLKPAVSIGMKGILFENNNQLIKAIKDNL